MSKFKIGPLCTSLPIEEFFEQFIERFCKVLKDKATMLASKIARANLCG